MDDEVDSHNKLMWSGEKKDFIYTYSVKTYNESHDIKFENVCSGRDALCKWFKKNIKLKR